jgi:hypothetical protein
MTPLEDALFWSRQLSEHALFFSLGLTEQPYQRTASNLHQLLETARLQAMRLSDIVVVRRVLLPIVQTLERFQLEVMDRMQAKWLGWLPPLFWDHTLRELRYFYARVWGPGLPEDQTLAANLRFMREHAEFAAHLLDPSQSGLISEAETAAGAFSRIEQNCCAPLTPALIELSMSAGQALDRYLTTRPVSSPALGAIHPTLAAHVVREGQRFLATLGEMSEVNPSP